MLKKQYAVYIADTSLARNIHYHLRYRVYCERKHYEAPIGAGVPEERDSHDPFATHFIVRNGRTKLWQGTARLILSTRTLLPIQRFGALYPHAEKKLLKSPVAEVSRLAALRSTCSWSPSSCHLLQATIIGLIDYSRRRGIENLMYLISPGLERILTRLGISMEACGPIVEHRGQRQAFSASVSQTIQNVPWIRRNLNGKHAEHFCNYFSESAFSYEDSASWTESFASGGTTAFPARAAPAL